MKRFFDSSALVKRYIQEKGSDLVDRLFSESESVMVSCICLPEIISTFSRLRSEKKLSSVEYNQYKGFLLEDYSAFEVCQLSPEVLGATIHVLERSGLKAADAIHVASAITAKASRFVSSDVKQIVAAKEFDLTVDSV